MKLSKWETQIRINHYEWCKANGRDTKWFETDKREGLRDKRKRQVDNLNAENSERFIKDAQAKRTSASD